MYFEEHIIARVDTDICIFFIISFRDFGFRFRFLLFGMGFRNDGVVLLPLLPPM